MGCKCYVGCCGVTSETQRLFSFSKNRFCLNRITSEEIFHGEPTTAPGTVHHEHNPHYHQHHQEDEEDTTGATLVIGRLGQDFHEHPSCSNAEAGTYTQEKKDICPKALRLQNGYYTRLYSEKVEAQSLTADYNYVKEATSNSSVLIVDVREPDEVKEHGKIPNSINIPLSSVPAILGEMSDKEFQKNFNKQKPSANSEIIFYCMIGKRSGKAQQDAINLGYKNTKNYFGSWTDWANNQK